MLQINLPSDEYFDESTSEFIPVKDRVLQLEHSLISLSKWESKWQKPFISNKEKTDEEIIDYFRCMTLTQNVEPDIYQRFNNKVIDQINKYINSPMTATTFVNRKANITSREIITSEIIYYWMILFNIPFECQKWHLNRLLTLINVCSVKNQPKKKMGLKEQYLENRKLNAARRAALHSRG